MDRNSLLQSTLWKRKADLEIAYNNGYSDAEYKI